MANTKFQFKRTTISGRLPNTTNSANTSYIDAGEFAINLTDGKVVSSNGSITFEVGANLSSLNLDGALTANGSTGSNGQVLTSNASGVYWSNVSAGGAGVNTYAQYTWTNTQTFSANVTISNSAVLIANGSFGTNNQVLISNGTGMYWGNVAIATVNTSIVTYTYNIASNTTVITGADNNSNTLSYYTGLESVYLNGSKLIAANDYTTTNTSTITLAANAVATDVVQIVAITPTVVPTIYDTVNTLSIGNSTVNTTINSTAFSGTANNANNLGGISLSTLQTQITGNAATAYSNAVANAGWYADQAYTNATTYSANASNLGNGTVAPARLGTGTANSSTVLYGNGVWAASAGGGGSSNASALTTGIVNTSVLASGTANSTTILYGNSVWAAAPDGVNTAFQYTFTNTISFSSNVILVSGNGTNQLLLGTINATSIGALANSTVLTIGNSSVNTTVNATSFSGTANNANNLGGTSLTTLQTQITGNATTAYTNATSYADTIAGTAYSNAVANASYVAGQAYTNAATNASYMAAQAYSNAVANAAAVYQTTAGLSANVLVLTSNAAGYLSNSSGTLTNIQDYITGNAATAYTNATIFAANGSNINTGTVSSARLGTGTANSSTVLYGNGVWAASAGGGGSSNASALTTGIVNTSVLASGTANSTTILYGNNVWSAPPSSTLISEQFTANGSSAVFTISGGYASNQLLVFVNGVKQIPTTDVDLSSGTTITLTQTPLNGYIIDVFGYSPVASYSVTGTANTTTYLGNSSGTIGNITSWISGNASTAYTNGTSYADTKAGTAYTNATSYADTKAGTAYTNGTSYADTKAGTAYTNATSYADTKAEAEGATAYTNAISYADTKAATAYANAAAYAAALTSNASNLTTGTLATARLPATANIATLINVGANVNLSTSALTVGNSTVNTTVNATSLIVGSNVATFGTAVYHVANGNVGIQTSLPDAHFHISSGSAKVRIGLTTSNQYADIYRDSPTGFIIYNAAQASPFTGHVWQVNSTEYMRIAANGNVGIGNSTPGSALVVNGAIITGNTQLGNNQVATVAFAIAAAFAL